MSDDGYENNKVFNERKHTKPIYILGQILEINIFINRPKTITNCTQFAGCFYANGHEPITTLTMLKQSLFLILFLPTVIFANNHPNLMYIQKYSGLAVKEMQESGIPASIKLAQGILESSWGKSESALYYNNHFGIKCKSNWNGDSFNKEDDDFDAQGHLVPSCFRAYKTASESYRDHSKFLKSSPRYKKLFQLDKTDYINWAIGLQQCGYASNQAYALKLIDLIEKYNLQRFDKLASPEKPVYFLSTPISHQENYTPAPQKILARPLSTSNAKVSEDYLPFEIISNQHKPQNNNNIETVEAPPVLPTTLANETKEEVLISFRHSYDKHYQQIARKPRIRNSQRR
ncbi:MAG TPA: hypothetical protein ENK52_05155 [Saprospiraceae bacterium]|nr:hypothetical protein [Saprospiraceae bacterium]